VVFVGVVDEGVVDVVLGGVVDVGCLLCLF